MYLINGTVAPDRDRGFLMQCERRRRTAAEGVDNAGSQVGEGKGRGGEGGGLPVNNNEHVDQSQPYKTQFPPPTLNCHEHHCQRHRQDRGRSLTCDGPQQHRAERAATPDPDMVRQMADMGFSKARLRRP